MLRPTESAIIFIQQLGRGLRKIDGKKLRNCYRFYREL
jgi:superfamily II DNA or RNA helicase